MKTKIILSSVVIILSLVFYSCDLLQGDGKDLGGDPSPMGEVNNDFGVMVSSFPGVSNASAKVTARDGDVSTVTYSVKITDPTLMNLVKAMPDVIVNGDNASVSRDYRITTKGFQSVYEEGNLTIVDYDAKVGDKYSIKHDGKTIVREVKSVSKTDDYAWGFMDIKVVRVEETGRNIPGLSKVEFVANHKWGMVGVILHFEDGSQKTIGLMSTASNE